MMGGGAPSYSPPPLPPAPPPVPTQVDPSVRRARANIRRRAIGSGGRSSTIAASPQGIEGDASGRKKTLLGT